MEFKFQVQTKVQKPVSDVFDAVYNPRKLEGYFTTKMASAPLVEGTAVMWEFADHPGAFPVHVKKVVPDELIVFEWEARRWPLQHAGRDALRASRCRIDARHDRRVRLEKHGEGPRELLPELPGLDAHELLPQGVPRVRHQPPEGLLLSGVIAAAHRPSPHSTCRCAANIMERTRRSRCRHPDP